MRSIARRTQSLYWRRNTDRTRRAWNPDPARLVCQKTTTRICRCVCEDNPICAREQCVGKSQSSCMVSNQPHGLRTLCQQPRNLALLGSQDGVVLMTVTFPPCPNTMPPEITFSLFGPV